MELNSLCIHGLLCYGGHCSECKRNEKLRAATPIKNYLRFLGEILSERTMADIERGINRVRAQEHNHFALGAGWPGKVQKAPEGEAAVLGGRAQVANGRRGKVKKSKVDGVCRSGRKP